ncbi:MAG: arginine--tRNA ligase, partial [Armatimonadetes bacterium]|nr:arginine--tRNA ligase [Armatimonadota bacterium]
MTRDAIAAALAAALARAHEQGQLPELSLPEIEISVPPRPDMGDFSANVALVLAKPAQMKPRDLAQIIVDCLDAGAAGCERVEIAGPGFINFFLGCGWLHQATAELLAQGEQYGHAGVGEGRKVQLEFISANPVGPIHIGNARGGPYGDVLANMFAAMGYDVQREYYVNDGPHNTQALLFGLSLQARYRELLGLESTFPENGYKGEYVVEMARQLVAEEGSALADLPADEAGAYEFFRRVEPGIVDETRRVV